MKTLLPNVDVQIITREDFTPDLSEDLERHLQQARTEARQRLMSATDSLAD